MRDHLFVSFRFPPRSGRPLFGITRVIPVKLIIGGSAASCCRVGGQAEELADLGPGEALVAGVGDGLGQQCVGLGEQAGQGVQVDAAVPVPVRVPKAPREGPARLSWTTRTSGATPARSAARISVG